MDGMIKETESKAKMSKELLWKCDSSILYKNVIE